MSNIAEEPKATSPPEMPLALSAGTTRGAAEPSGKLPQVLDALETASKDASPPGAINDELVVRDTSDVEIVAAVDDAECSELSVQDGPGTDLATTADDTKAVLVRNKIGQLNLRVPIHGRSSALDQLNELLFRSERQRIIDELAFDVGSRYECTKPPMITYIERQGLERPVFEVLMKGRWIDPSRINDELAAGRMIQSQAQLLLAQANQSWHLKISLADLFVQSRVRRRFAEETHCIINKHTSEEWDKTIQVFLDAAVTVEADSDHRADGPADVAQLVFVAIEESEVVDAMEVVRTRRTLAAFRQPDGQAFVSLPEMWTLLAKQGASIKPGELGDTLGDLGFTNDKITLRDGEAIITKRLWRLANDGAPHEPYIGADEEKNATVLTTIDAEGTKPVTP